MTNVTNPTIAITTPVSEVVRITTKPSDIMVVNAARVSFDKESELEPDGSLKVGDQRLLNYLATHGHWTPFTHVRETFAFDEDWFDIDWFMQTVNQENLASISIAKADVYGKPSWVIRHSLYGWIQLLKLNESEHIFQPADAYHMQHVLTSIYPGSMLAYNMFLVDYEPDLHLKTVEHITDIDADSEEPIIEFYQPEKRDYFIDITLRESVSIYVARQRFKSSIGFCVNEISRRYVDFQPTYLVPDILRGRAENKKQGSTDDPCDNHDDALNLYNDIINSSDSLYELLVDKDGEYKLCPEQARGILPQAMMTSYYATGNLAAWKRLVKQRQDDHAQKEIRDYADLVAKIISEYE